MKERIEVVILSIIIMILLIPLFFNGLTSNRWIYKYDTYLDFNSGDYKEQSYVFNILIREKIQETLFSKEVRRLGIEVPEQRIWKCTGNFPFSHIGGNTQYSEAHRRIVTLVKWLYILEIPDKERLDIMQKALKCLQTDDTGKVQEIYNMTNSLNKKTQ